MGRWRVPAVALSGVLVGMLLAGPQSVRATWEQLTQILSLRGDPVPASANVLSEHHLELLDRQPPQDQATFLLERAMCGLRAVAVRHVERRTTPHGCSPAARISRRLVPRF